MAYKIVVGVFFVCFNAVVLRTKTYKEFSVLSDVGFRSSHYFERVRLLSPWEQGELHRLLF